MGKARGHLRWCEEGCSLYVREPPRAVPTWKAGAGGPAPGGKGLPGFALPSSRSRLSVRGRQVHGPSHPKAEAGLRMEQVRASALQSDPTLLGRCCGRARWAPGPQVACL